MNKRMNLMATCLAVGALGGCLGETTGPACTPIESAQQAVSGDTIITTTGLRYIETRVGTGATAQWCQTVAPQITGTLLDGTTFQPKVRFAFTPGFDRVIPGFAEGVVGMRDGGSRRLIVPPALGYGAEEQRDRNTNQVVIPANSTLIFDVLFGTESNP
ncbi:MAG: FKBP-type peptidyl-prolyl cis-trans isomerase [Gemmatimonadota bacterium]|nr:FKBP-type peptidyl-prolyl cis-trans isomerase [Gemmatimonadota bacterium]